MASISIGEAIGQGFSLIRARPVTVLAWGALQTAGSLALTMVIGPTYADMMRTLPGFATGGATPAATMADIGPLLQFEGVMLLVAIVGGFFSMILYCAVLRAVLRPEANSLAYLRVGLAEVMLFVFAICAAIGLVISMFIAFIPVFLLAAIAAVAHAPAVSALLVVLGYIGILVLLVWAAVRLSLVGPMMIWDGRFHFRDAWRLTKGHAGALFAIGLCLVAVMLVVMAVNLALVLSMGGAQAQTLMQALQAHPGAPPAQLLPPLTPTLVIRYLIAIPVSGCLTAIWGAPWARAYRDLAQPDVAATFA